MLRCIVFLQMLFASYLHAQTLVLPGDFPDPSVTFSGKSYWATATTSNWAPLFPLLESTDLLHWELKGHVFTSPPAWADYYFWAPEISYESGKYYVYYTAHKRGGNLCLAVASADRAEGPYTDHGPLMCQEAGSIDGWPMRDNNGKLYLIWKEDGNSVKLPTPIWAMEMDESRMKLTGEKKEIFRNDAPWEANLVEGVSMIRHQDYIYAFYAGAGCCGRACSYGIGVARAKDLLGPWEKYEGNPIIATTDEWKCPGHGTPIEKDGKYYFLYHAYDKESSVYAGRQGVLSEFKFTADGWIEFVNGPGSDAAIQPEISDDFNGNELAGHWQWSVFQKVNYTQAGGVLSLMGEPSRSGAFLGMKTLSQNYEAELIIAGNSSSAVPGLALVGDEQNFVMATVEKDQLVVRKVEADKETVIEQKTLPGFTRIHLRAVVKDGKDISFFYSVDGKKFTALNDKAVDGFFLPPWDRAVRAALVSKGVKTQKAVFDRFILKNN